MTQMVMPVVTKEVLKTECDDGGGYAEEGGDGDKGGDSQVDDGDDNVGDDHSCRGTGGHGLL